mgnify:CR=1 FL=1
MTNVTLISGMESPIISGPQMMDFMTLFQHGPTK